MLEQCSLTLCSTLDALALYATLQNAGGHQITKAPLTLQHRPITIKYAPYEDGELADPP